MPITVDALVLGLTAGAKSYNTGELGFAGGQGSTYDQNRLLVQIFGSSVTAAQDLHAGESSYTTATFTTPATTGDAAPNFKVKSYLNAPVICPVGASGTVGKIAFSLQQQAGADKITNASESVHANYTFPNLYNGIPPYATEIGTGTAMGDIFMVITVSPGIAVTEGGYLTVKGWATGVTGSDSFTYITLQSGS